MEVQPHLLSFSHFSGFHGPISSTGAVDGETIPSEEDRGKDWIEKQSADALSICSRHRTSTSKEILTF
jgi:hypothetical protein